MFQIFMTAKQAVVIEKSIRLYNQIQFGELEYLVDSFLEVCTKKQKKNADAAAAKNILSKISSPSIMSPHPIDNNLEILPVPCSEQYTMLLDTETTLRGVSRALDFYSRVIMGQWTVVCDELYFNFTWDQKDEINKQLSIARGYLIPKLNDTPCSGGWGISHPDNPVESKIAYEMHGVIRHFFWMLRPDAEKASYTVDASNPLKFSQEPFIKIQT